MVANIKEVVETAVDRMKDEIIDILQRLVCIPSVTGDEGEAQQFIYKQYEAAGLEVLKLEADHGKIKDHPAFCNSDKPYEKFDYIFYNSKSIKKLESGTIHGAGTISDHLLYS